MKITILLFALTLAITATLPTRVAAQDDGPQVLIVTAHPDDEAMFASAVYKITHELDGKADLALVTDGAGGYRFSTLAEPIYGLELTDPEIAKQYLPTIRKRELMAAGQIIGIRNYFFFDQPDLGRSDDVQEFFSGTWDTTYVKDGLQRIMLNGNYDFVFVHLPVSSFHAHHKVASILALEVAARLDAEVRPAVLGGWFLSREDTTEFHFDQLEGFPVTRVDESFGPFSFDMNQPIGLDGRLNYKIVKNWLIAEHKSQGTMQNFVCSTQDEELYFYFAVNDDHDKASVDRLFARLAVPRPVP